MPGSTVSYFRHKDQNVQSIDYQVIFRSNFIWLDIALNIHFFLLCSLSSSSSSSFINSYSKCRECIAMKRIKLEKINKKVYARTWKWNACQNLAKNSIIETEECSNSDYCLNKIPPKISGEREDGMNGSKWEWERERQKEMWRWWKRYRYREHKREKRDECEYSNGKSVDNIHRLNIWAIWALLIHNLWRS